MKGEDTKEIILKKALELFSEKGYDAVSVGEIAKAVGIKAPSLYNHYSSKSAIFEAIVDKISEHYERDTAEIDIHVQSAERDYDEFSLITSEALKSKVRQIFMYSINDETIRRFRKMMTIEQFRSPRFAELYSERYVDRMVGYHKKIFERLIEKGEIIDVPPETLSIMYISPVITLLGICDRQPERVNECLEKLDEHVETFFETFNTHKA